MNADIVYRTLTDIPDHPRTQGWFQGWFEKRRRISSQYVDGSDEALIRIHGLDESVSELNFDALEALLERTSRCGDESYRTETDALIVFLIKESRSAQGKIMLELSRIDDDDQLLFCLNAVNKVAWHCNQIERFTETGREISDSIWSRTSDIILGPIPDEWKTSALDGYIDTVLKPMYRNR